MPAMNTDWFHDARWGVFVHYGPRPGYDSWDAQIEAFDVDAVVRQLVEVKAGYFFLTITHGHGMFCCPTETYDRLLALGPDESRCSKRDLISDLADALAPVGIRMMVYFPADSPRDPYVTKKLRWIGGQTLGWDIEGNKIRAGRRPVEFMRNWDESARLVVGRLLLGRAHLPPCRRAELQVSRGSDEGGEPGRARRLQRWTRNADHPAQRIRRLHLR